MDIWNWIDARTGIAKAWQAIFLRKMPAGLGWAHTLGSASLFVFGLQFLTGMFLAMYYSPSPDHAYDSVLYITNEATFGSVIRGLHHWGASAMVVLVVLHMVRVFAMGAYKFPHEVTWLAGVALLLLTLGFGFTGYLLPWDEKAYWATTVGTNIMGLVPVVGGFLLRAVRGGADIGALTLTRFYSTHVLLLPALTAGGLFFHLSLVIRNGISAPPDVETERIEARQATPAVPSTSRWPWAAPDPQARSAYLSRGLELKSAGRSFFPDILVKDAVAALVVFLFLLILTVWRGVPTEGAADPTNTVYVPRPEWYFMFLFEFLKHVPGQLEGLAAVGLPAMAVVLLLAWPFLDRSPARHPRLRPYAMSLLVLALAGVLTLTVRAFQTTPPSIVQARGERLTAVEQAGRSLFKRSCAGCHTVDGSGMGPGPDLGGLTESRDSVWVHNYIENPGTLNPGAAMPSFIPALSHQEVEMITSYLMSLRAAPPPTPSPVQEFEIEAFQYGFSPATISVVAGLPVRLIITSKDVEHGLAIPDLDVEAHISVGRMTIVEFVPTVPGEYTFECAVFCGTGHARMQGRIIVR